MATELRLTRTLRGFEPSDDESREAIKEDAAKLIVLAIVGGSVPHVTLEF